MKTVRFLPPFAGALLLAASATVHSAPSAPTPAETKALAVLTSSADVHTKTAACRELAVIGGPASVAGLAALLDHEQLADYARSGLEAIRDPSAGRALRSALPKLNGRQLAGAVNSLGVRRESAAVVELRALALDGIRGAAPEAIAGLGLIATPEAAKALEHLLGAGPAGLRLPAAHASLVAAERLTKEKNSGAARSLLDAVVRSQPPKHVLSAAQQEVAALGSRR